MKKDGLAPPPAARDWTRIDDYLVHMRRRDAASRSRRRLRPRSEPETPRFMMSTLPFLALLAILGVMTIAMMIVAWPGEESSVRSPPPSSAVHEAGTAPRGWLQEARREMR
ncbi:hypothetical protein [Sphingomonas sp.]|uniref:hypothetical protein n=1 Tax=Sphingomonas sp. TaxID=28214 RepID=UPI0025D57ABD|nr:hypothetical protein [Sphingomonas sp.]MBV9528546.1 hypothetical protein [Sphingomonas sp.]